MTGLSARMQASPRARQQVAVPKVGNWVPGTRLPELLAALSRRRFRTLRLVGHPHGPLLWRPRQGSPGRPHLNERVVVHGQVSVAEVAGSTLPLMSSRWRAPGNPPGRDHGEAMAAGMPVIGRPAGTSHTWQTAARAWLSPDDVAALADALCRLATDALCGVRWVSGPACPAGHLPKKKPRQAQPLEHGPQVKAGVTHHRDGDTGQAQRPQDIRGTGAQLPGGIDRQVISAPLRPSASRSSPAAAYRLIHTCR